MKTKQTNTKNGLKEFFRPTWGKLTVPIIFLLIFFLLPLLGILLKIRFVIIFWLIVIAIASLPILPIIKAAGLTTTGPVYFDAFGGPTMLGFLLIGIFDAIVLYLISCLVVYLKKRRKRKDKLFCLCN